VLLYLRAAGGLAGLGGGSVAGVASSNSTSGSTTYVVQGIPDGQRGADGVAGDARIEITGTALSLGNGDDRLTFDLLASGPGTNQVIVSGNSFDGGAGTDRLSLGTGKLGEPGAVLDVNLGFFRLGTSPVDNIITGFEVFDGTVAADAFIGGGSGQTYALMGGNDSFVGAGGNEEVNGGDDADVINGGGGNDTLLGGSGNDRLDGDEGNDRLTGGDGADTLSGGAGNDSLAGDGGADLVSYAELTGASQAITVDLAAQRVTGAAGADTLSGFEHVLAGAGNDSLLGDGNANTLSGGLGDDTLAGGLGDDTLSGDAGNDLFFVTDARNVVLELVGGGADTIITTVSITMAPHLETLRIADGISGITISGGAANDVLIGNGLANIFNGGAGDDVILAGNVTLADISALFAM
jgi:Ca2+-binding RTX toxin-like protein